MSKKIEFMFDDKLDYQLDAVQSVIDLFRGLPRYTDNIYRTRQKKIAEGDPVRNESIGGASKLLSNLKDIQLRNELFLDNEIFNYNFTVEMETGTGKTYVYLRTILELHKEYGFKKFMIVVPTVAIRKGVEKSIEQLNEHFKRIYSLDLIKHSFVYDSDNPKKVSTNLVETNTLSICVLNIQAFNKSNNKIRTSDEYGQIIWEDIKYIKPIVIIDEPQKIEGQKGKKSKSLEAIDELEPLFTLRYSATHKNLYNQIYKLDSYQAYKNNLVKKIQVKTVNCVIEKEFPYVRYLSFTKDLKARIEIFHQRQGDPTVRFKTFNVVGNTSLEELSGGLKQYKNMRILENPHKEKPLHISSDSGDIFIEQGKSNKLIEDIEAIRIQIRLAIKNHFEKQIELLENNLEIKGLTLFFIDKVINVRDESREDGRGDFLRIFDEEYQLYIDANKAQIEKYKDYFKNYEDVLNVREGYFAKDKNRKDVEVQYSKSGEVVAKSEEEINNAISLILERKDELISFEEPLSFIFSHSALREGWDNPNVFTICTLKQGSNEIAKKQEIGRGLRLPVDIHGNRCLDSNVNELTVIANDSYDNFSKMLQADFNEDININEVTYDILSITLSRAGISKSKITTELVNEFRSELLENDIINEKNILKHKAEKTTKLIKKMTFKNVTLEEHKTKITEKLIRVMNEKGSNKIEVKNGDNEDYVNDYTSLVTQEHFMRVYTKLCDYLRKRTIYKCNIDKDDFVLGCAAHINEYLTNFSVDNSYTVSVGTSSFDNTGTFNIDKISETEVEYCVNSLADAKSDFEIVNYIMYHTMLPRMTIFNILKKIKNRNALNVSTILDVITIKIKDYLENIKANNVISYEVIEGFELDTTNIFSVDKITDLDFLDEKKREKLFEWKSNKSSSLNKYYKLDSEGEKEFAQKLEANDKILMFAKIKKGGFIIDTPYGNYSPDWAIICKEDVANEIGIYFIVETKAQKEARDLTAVEINKIKCGELHFKAVSDIIKFDWVNSYNDFKRKFNI